MSETVRNLLAEFYAKLATMAFERHQFDLAADYCRMANQALYKPLTRQVQK